MKSTSAGDGDEVRWEFVFTGKSAGHRVRSGTSEIRRIGTDEYGKNGGSWSKWSASGTASEPGTGAGQQFLGIAGSLREDWGKPFRIEPPEIG